MEQEAVQEMKQNATLLWVVSVWWLTIWELVHTGVHVIWTTFGTAYKFYNFYLNSSLQSYIVEIRIFFSQPSYSSVLQRICLMILQAELSRMLRRFVFGCRHAPQKGEDRHPFPITMQDSNEEPQRLVFIIIMSTPPVQHNKNIWLAGLSYKDFTIREDLNPAVTFSVWPSKIDNMKVQGEIMRENIESKLYSANVAAIKAPHNKNSNRHSFCSMIRWPIIMTILHGQFIFDSCVDLASTILDKTV